MNHTERAVLIATALTSLGANTSSAVTSNNGALAQRDIYTGETRAAGARDPYTDGARAGKLEIYSDGVWVSDTHYPATGGSPSRGTTKCLRNHGPQSELAGLGHC